MDVIDQEIRLCGYFVIITSEGMTAEEALTLYKSRDSSEKLFCGDKSYLGDKAERASGSESLDTRRTITLDEKTEKAQAVVFRGKDNTMLR